MAAVVGPEDFATPEEFEAFKAKVLRTLTIQPRAKAAGFGAPAPPPGPPVRFFAVESPAAPGESPPATVGHIPSRPLRLRVPYAFAVENARPFPNGPPGDPALPPTAIAFTGRLLAHQEPVAARAWADLLRTGTATLNVHTGFGKTILAAFLAARAGLVACVLVHRTILVGQWRKTFEDFTDAEVWVPGEGPAPAAFRLASGPTAGGFRLARARGPNVVICMAERWALISPELRAQVGLLVVDEAHSFCTPTRPPALLAFRPRFVVAETATLERDDGMDAMMRALCGSHAIVARSAKPFVVVRVATGVEPEARQTPRGMLDWSHLVETTLYNAGRDELIVEIVRANAGAHKILVLTAQIEHARALAKKVAAAGFKTAVMAGAAKKYSDSRVLVGTLSKIGTGFDEATACADYGGERIDLAVLACSIKKRALLEQCVGRAFRASLPIVFHLYDKHRVYSTHWREAKAWYLSRNGRIFEVKAGADLTAERFVAALDGVGALAPAEKKPRPAAPKGESEEQLAELDLDYFAAR